ncbi:helix-turn-helix domain-containing protein [Chitinimonas lacunae]|uniref:Helix-turn-helix domain-containing protein n=1 Tax=Chitinimonas lacunae TaxID=1963018 RepID=A0ABV8MNK6_9NEIS
MKRARQLAGLRISDAAELLGVSESTLRNWEHGRTRCPVVYWEFLLIVTCGSRFDQQLRWVKAELTAARHWGVERVDEGCSQRVKRGTRVSR